MNTIKSLALAVGSAAVLIGSLAQASVTPLSPIPAGTYGDHGVATLAVSRDSAALELPCSTATFGAIDYNAENGKFSVSGEQKSDLPSNIPSTPVTLTGTASKCEPDGACRTTTAYITATLSNSETGVVLGNYAFIVNAPGVGERCQ